MWNDMINLDWSLLNELGLVYKVVWQISFWNEPRSQRKYEQTRVIPAVLRDDQVKSKKFLKLRGHMQNYLGLSQRQS